jgi:hypothetical protein
VLIDGRVGAWVVLSLLDLEMDAMMQFNFYDARTYRDHAALARDSSTERLHRLSSHHHAFLL